MHDTCFCLKILILKVQILLVGNKLGSDKIIGSRSETLLGTMPSSNTVGHNSSSKKAMIEFATDSYSSLILDIIYYMNIHKQGTW